MVAGTVLLGGVPALAAAERQSDLPSDLQSEFQSELPGTGQAESAALLLLDAASRADQDLTYAGTQYVASWDGQRTGSVLVEIRHDPHRGTVAEGDGGPAVTSTLDPSRVALLAQAYDLAIVGPGTCTGRAAQVVEARRSGGQVAGRFWLDRESGLLLRHEVFDETGDRVRSTAFVDLAVTGRAVGTTVRTVELPGSEAVRDLERDGWRVPSDLPGGFRLLDTLVSTPGDLSGRGEQVLHLSYSDGLSSLSLFAQQGRLGTAQVSGFDAETVASRPVWVQHAAPERVIWAGGGQVWTLVSDATSQRVRDAVAALPRDRAPQDGLRSRLGRGMARVAGMLNPFG